MQDQPGSPACGGARELTANGVVEPARLYESPYIDHAPTGPDFLFPDTEVDVIVDILREVTNRSLGPGAA